MFKAGCNRFRALAAIVLLSNGGDRTGTSSVQVHASMATGASALRQLEEGACSADGLFVDSAISDKNNPIGGCYQMSNVTTNGYSSFVLDGGDLDVGKAWLYVSEGTWNIGIVEDDIDIDLSGVVESSSTICTSTTLAATVFDPTDSQLEGDWTCSYFEGGVTNYEVEADFEMVECGCEGKAVTTDGSSDGSLFGTAATAIAILVTLAVLLVLVMVSFCFVRRRRRRKAISNQTSKAGDVKVGNEIDDVA